MLDPLLYTKIRIKNNNKTIYSTSEIQPLYLYPLTLKDYVENIDSEEPIKITILKTKEVMNYEEFFQKEFFQKLKVVEIVIHTKQEIKKVIEIIHLLYKKNILISLLIEDLTFLTNDDLKAITKEIKYFKIMWKSKKRKTYKNKLKLIAEIKRNDTLVHIKDYLKLEEIDHYDLYIKDLTPYIDIYQLSKELLPLGKDNIIIDNKYEEIIRQLEKKYKNNPRFISVKNLKELYYPRFELEDRNSHNCYACRLKPYLYEDIILPCKVKKVLDHKNLWGKRNEMDRKNFEKCGKECDDCASIYENDILDSIKKIIKGKKIEVEMERDDNE